MSSEDDVVYRKSVRNMSVVLAAIVITIFAALFIPPYVNPVHDNFQRQVAIGSPFGFTLSLEVNSTTVDPAGYLTITGWVNGSSSPLNITAKGAWPVDVSSLWGRICTTGWPIGVGVMEGHYTRDNYTSGTLVPLHQPLNGCPVSQATPPWFAIIPHSSKALVTIAGVPEFWVLQSTLTFGHGSIGESRLRSGVYTVVAADEWGDILLTNFIVS